MQPDESRYYAAKVPDSYASIISDSAYIVLFDGKIAGAAMTATDMLHTSCKLFLLLSFPALQNTSQVLDYTLCTAQYCDISRLVVQYVRTIWPPR